MLMFNNILKWCLNNTGALGVIIAIISLYFANKGIKQWKIDKMIDMHYKFKEERTSILDEIKKLNTKNEDYQENMEILYIDLLNELELISLLHQKKYLEDNVAKQMFNTWIQPIYDLEDIQKIISQARRDDPQAYENLEKTYRAWNKKEVNKWKQKMILWNKKTIKIVEELSRVGNQFTNEIKYKPSTNNNKGNKNE